MKQGKNPTRAQKEIITENKLRSENWLVLTDSKELLTIQNKTSGKIRTLEKPVKTGGKGRRR